MADVVADMHGTILEIFVGVGDVVKQKDELMVLEAMKMENPVIAPSGGTIKQVLVKVGENVTADQVLAVIG